MNLFLILIVVAGVFGLVYPFYIKSKFARAVSWICCAAVGLSLVPVPEISIDGYYLFIIAQVLVILYAFSQEHFTAQKKGLLAAVGALGLLPLLLFISVRQANVEWMVCSLGIIAICVYVLVRQRQSFKEEFGFLAVIGTNALVNFFMILSGLL